MQDLDRRGLATLASGHAAADLCQGSIPALIPFLVHQRGYSFGAAGALLLVVTIGSSIIQPVFGALSDRLQLAWLMPAGVALAAVGIAGAGVFDSFAATAIPVGLGGLGVAAFHPEGARYANYASGDRRGTGMSLFSVGGNAGFALAPVLITPAVLLVGLSGTLIVAILPAIAAVVLAVELPSMKRRSAAAAQAVADSQTDRSDDRWGAFSTLAGVVSIRSGVYFGLQSFAALVGGRLVDRIGRRTVLIGSIVAQLPLLLAFMLSPTGVLAGVLLAGIGFVTVMSFSVSVVMGQEYLPSRLGIASGVTLGFAIGVGGVAAALLGALADHAGLHTVMWTITLLPIAGTALALTLPESAVRARPAIATALHLR